MIGRALPVMLALVLTHAGAKLCDRERPPRDGSHARMWDEFIHQAAPSLTAAILLLAAALIWSGQIWSAGLAVMITLTCLLVFIEPNPMEDMQREAMQEGCIGDARLWYGCGLALVTMAVLRLGHLLWRKPA